MDRQLTETHSALQRFRLASAGLCAFTEPTWEKQKEIEHKLRNETIAKFLPKLYDRINNSWKIFHDSDRPIHHYNSSYFKLGTEQKKLCQGETIALLDSGNFELNTETLEWVVKNKWDKTAECSLEILEKFL